jgi:hypothetical protein
MLLTLPMQSADEDGGAHILHSEKVDALAELVEENSSENFLVAYNFDHVRPNQTTTLPPC